MLIAQALLAGGVSGPAASGAGGGGATSGIPVPGVSEIRTNSQTIPPGGTAQVQFSLTEPKPIMTGTGRFGFSFADTLFGASVNSPGGDAFGVAAYSNGTVNVNIISPQFSLGTITDYPIVTLTSHVSADALPGSTYPLSANLSLVAPTGTSVIMAPVNGTLTIGGSLFVNNVLPGGGSWPAGTVVRILGGGFSRGTTISRSSFRIRSLTFVSASELDIVLDKTTILDSQRIDVTNPDKAKTTITYYSYLRGVEAVKSAEPLVVATDPMYPQLTYLRVAAMQAPFGINQSILTALSMQNPNQTPVIVKLEAQTAFGKIAETTITLGFGERITRELGEFFGQALPVGATVKATSTLPIQFLGFTADRATGDVTPFMPFAF